MLGSQIVPVIPLAFGVVISYHTDPVHNIDQRIFVAVWLAQRWRYHLPHLDLEDMAQFINAFYVSNQGGFHVLVS